MQTKSKHPDKISFIHNIAVRIVSQESIYADDLIKELNKVQPFLTLKIFESSKELDTEATEELLTLYLVVWEVYREFPGCHNEVITSQQYDQVKNRNISMFKYLNNEDDMAVFREIVSADNQKLNQADLMEYVSYCFQSLSSLTNLSPGLFCKALIHIKSFIECLAVNAEHREQRA